MSLEFLETLEGRVREAAERLEELTTENAAFRVEVEKLERERSAAAPPKPERTAGRLQGAVEKSEKVWAKERDEVRRRLSALIARLEALL